MRIALWQCEQRPLDVAGNLRRLDAAAARAAADGADLLLVPEMFLTGYAIGAEATRRLAEPADGPAAQAMAALAQRHGVAMAWGYPERAGADVFNAAQCVDAQGRMAGHHRKVHLYGDADRAAFTPAAGFSPVFVLKGWRVAFLICYDLEFPEAVRAAALAGAELLLVPTANMTGFDAVPLTLLPARAYENQCFVAYANCCGSEGTGASALTYAGLSAVAAPDGSVLARAGRGDSWLLADLDPAHPGRHHNSYLADRRPALYHALVESDAALNAAARPGPIPR